jgi:hypothetical protein
MLKLDNELIELYVKCSKESESMNDKDVDRLIKLIKDNNKLKDALEYLLDFYIQVSDNACRCSDMYFDDDTELCPYCNAKKVLKEVK